MLQLQLAPQVQQTTEYRHADTVLGELSSVQADSIQAATAGTDHGTTLTVGSDYPNYLVLVQPPGPYGTVSMDSSRTVTIENAEATDSEAAQFLDGDAVTYRTGVLRYDPDYQQYTSAPSIELSNTALYANYSDDTTIVATPDVVAGRRITLVATRGRFSLTTSEPTMLRTDALSASGQSVRVSEADSSSHIKLRLQTSLSLSTWRQLLASEIDADTTAASPASDNDGRFIAELTMDEATSPNTVVVHLESGTTYRLNAALIGYRTGHQAPFNRSQHPDARYLDAETNTDPVVSEENTRELTVRVRDRFHNPGSDVKVTATVLGEGSLDRRGGLSDSDGSVTFQYTAPEITEPQNAKSSETHRVRVRIDGETGPAYAVVFEIDVQNAYN